MLLMFPQRVFRIPFLSDFGFFAVNFFFVISGFIIYEVISRERDFKPVPFLVKRFFRLWPPYAFATVLYVSLFLIVENRPASVELITVQQFIQTLTFWPLQITPVLPPGWSLEHEVIFYLFAAIFTGGFGVTGLVVFLALNTVIAVSVYILTATKTIAPFWDYHLIDIMNAYFFLGVLASRYKEKLSRAGYVLPVIAGCILFVGGTYALGPLGFQVNYLAQFLTVGVGSFLIIVGLVNIDANKTAVAEGIKGFWLFKLMESIGDWSYSLYIIHFSTIPIFTYINNTFLPKDFGATYLIIAAFMAFNFLIAYVVHYSIEAPSAQYGSVVARSLLCRKTANDLDKVEQLMGANK